MLKCFVYGHPKLIKYPPEVRKFCFSLNYHSPAAYDIIRNYFDKRLPHPKTISAWLKESDLNGEHGFREETMRRLAASVKDLKESTGEDLICTGMLDEMFIMKEIYWDQKNFKYAGYPTYPNNTCKEKEIETESSTKGATNKTVKSPLATRALVFMLSGINKSFEFLVGYHFVNGLDAKGLTELVKEMIIKVSECGVKIANLTFDGAKANIKMCEILGANLNPSSIDFKPYINSPYDDSIIYLIFDASHMEKLLRNLLGNHGVLFDENDEEIKWSYFVDLYEASKQGELLTHKLTRKHTIEFKRNKMNVRLAVETFSTSTADSFKIMRENGHQEFIDSCPTEKFTRLTDTLWDISNSRDTRHTNIYKRPMNAENKRVIFDFIEKAKVYLKGLQMNRVRKCRGVERIEKVNVLKTINQTPIVGFLVNLTNIPLMYERYVERVEDDEDYSLQKMTHFRTYALSQDRLEITFGKIRARNGHNNNPNCAQFKGAYRRLQANIEVNPPSSANCMMFDPIDLHMFAPQSNVFTVSSRRPTFDILSDDTFQTNLKRFEEEQYNMEALSDLAGMRESTHLLEGFADASVAYASKLIEESIATGEFNCECCKCVFSQNEKLKDGSICLIPQKRPCESTYYICRIVDKYINIYKPDKKGNKKDLDFRVLYYKAFQEIDYNKIFVKTDFKDHEHHRFYLVKTIVQNYLYMKTAQISREITYEEYGKIIRSKLTKWIHFQGQ